jgi:hypothetical protein
VFLGTGFAGARWCGYGYFYGGRSLSSPGYRFLLKKAILFLKNTYGQNDNSALGKIYQLFVTYITVLHQGKWKKMLEF